MKTKSDALLKLEVLRDEKLEAWALAEKELADVEDRIFRLTGGGF